MDIMQAFDERLQEIDAYLDLLSALERQVQIGPPTIGGSPITVQHQKILYSSVYLQLYNLVEATATWCMSTVAESADSRWKPADLLENLRREWIRTTARTNIQLNEDHRHVETVRFCELLLSGDPLGEWKLDPGGGGNWDDRELERLMGRIGCDLQITRATDVDAKFRIRDDKGALGLVKYIRNRLAHGSISFEECGDGLTVADLQDLRRRTANWLRELITGFSGYIEKHLFLAPDRRPCRLDEGAFI